MISLDSGTKTCPLTREEVDFVAKSLTAALSGKPATVPAFTCGMHGHISVMSKKEKPAMHRAKKENRELRSNPPQSDHILTGC